MWTGAKREQRGVFPPIEQTRITMTRGRMPNYIDCQHQISIDIDPSMARNACANDRRHRTRSMLEGAGSPCGTLVMAVLV
ncbi:hypothetical protein X777_11339 [Ooceraea biroi]|uniref:Uncharacterized protein n=1 Tax=Ooceraea biroi TaxID=2015173 RepID=A0A026W285_OOCBI|nr:hypothetical protein X777_11339 [Ooceraea biroi]